MNPFDLSIIHFLQSLVGEVEHMDRLIVLIAKSHLFKGVIFMIIFWWLWFEKREERNRLFTLLFLAPFVALGSRLSGNLFDRPRPLHEPNLVFELPYGMKQPEIDWSSSLPSDHAALFFFLAAGFYLVSRRWGVILSGYALVVVCLPRIYLGIHYSTDILAGGVIGVLLAQLLRFEWKRFARLFLLWEAQHPASFYATGFIVTHQLSRLFDDIRKIGEFF